MAKKAKTMLGLKQGQMIETKRDDWNYIIVEMK